MTNRFTVAPASRPQSEKPKKPAPKKKPQWPGVREAKSNVYKAKPIRRGR